MSLTIRRLLLASSALLGMFAGNAGVVGPGLSATSIEPDFHSGGSVARNSNTGGSRAHRRWRKLRSSGRR